MKTKNFAAQVAADEIARQHADEIKNTRKGGLGGSDAAILMRIAEGGLAALTATDMARLCVMVGKKEQPDFGGNAYTAAGHAFEDFAEKNIPFGAGGYEREKVLSQNLALNFKTFAHADFACPDGTVLECKYVQQTTDACAKKYYAQLQWYYVLGAKNVVLYHGTGSVEPFEPAEAVLRKIPRDDHAIELLLTGVKLLDEALSGGWLPELQEKELLENAPEIVQAAFGQLVDIKAQSKALDERKKQANDVIKEYLEGFGLTGIVAGGETKQQVIYNKAGVTKTFDAAKFLEEHPEFDLPKYWKITNRAASVTFK